MSKKNLQLRRKSINQSPLKRCAMTQDGYAVRIRLPINVVHLCLPSGKAHEFPNFLQDNLNNKCIFKD